MTRLLALITAWLIRLGVLADETENDYLEWADCRLDELAAQAKR